MDIVQYHTLLCLITAAVYDVSAARSCTDFSEVCILVRPNRISRRPKNLQKQKQKNKLKLRSQRRTYNTPYTRVVIVAGRPYRKSRECVILCKLTAVDDVVPCEK